MSVRLHPDGSVRLHDEPAPAAGDGEVLLRVAAVGLCGSDRHWLVEGGIGEARVDSPLVLGHEFCGVVQEGPHRGRLVAADPTISCGHCGLCRSGRENLCQEQRFAGYSGTDGALRELVAWPERLLYPLADSVGPLEGVLVEPLAIALHAHELAGEIRDRRVGVVGCGPIGLLIVSLAKAAGAARVVVADPLQHRVAAAVERGGEALAHEARMSDELEVVFEVAGEDEAVDVALRLAAPGGEVLLVGIPAQDRISFTASVARRKGLTLRNVRRSTPSSFERASRLVAESWLELQSLVTHRLPLDQTPRAFEALAGREGIKVIVEPGTQAA